jgi:peptidylprolyl isomerase
MKLISLLLVPALAMPALAQTQPAAGTHATKPATAAAKRPAATATIAATPACAKLPDLSSKIPALPAGLPCARPLYTITTVPTVKLDYVSPLEDSGLRDSLGLEPSSFSLYYIDTKIGAGELATPHKWYTIHYTGYLLDGTKFDSSVDRNDPIVIPYGQHKVIPGWDTGFDGMHVGGKRRLFIPYQLAYGTSANGPIPAKSELIFDVELIAMSDTQPPPKPSEPISAPPGVPPGAAQSRPAAQPRPAIQPAASGVTADGTVNASANLAGQPAAGAQSATQGRTADGTVNSSASPAANPATANPATR